MEAHQQAMNKAKIALMSRPDSAFFTTVFFSLRQVWDPSVRTAGTDGTKVYFAPDFFMKWDQEQRLFLILHETLHAAYLHMARRGDRDPQRWNIAADHVINLQLIDRGFKMIPGGCADPQYKGMCVEDVYDRLPPSQTCPMPDLVEPTNKLEELDQNMREILVRASVASRMSGDAPGAIPGDIQIFLDKLLNPKLPWQSILRKHMHAMAKNDYTFRRPNRRFFPQHHLPSLWSENLANLAIAVDTSGSVGDVEFNHFISEVAGILKMMKPEKITVLQFDTRLKAVDEVRSFGDLEQLTFTGRGGTRIEPVLEWAKANKPQLLLVFSDGFFRFYDPDYRGQTIWLIHNNEKFSPPFGKTVHYEMEC